MSQAEKILKAAADFEALAKRAQDEDLVQAKRDRDTLALSVGKIVKSINDQYGNVLTHDVKPVTGPQTPGHKPWQLYVRVEALPSSAGTKAREDALEQARYQLNQMRPQWEDWYKRTITIAVG